MIKLGTEVENEEIKNSKNFDNILTTLLLSKYLK